MGTKIGSSALINNAKKDTPTVSRSGESLADNIAGVYVHKPPLHVDHRGALVEMFTNEAFWEIDFAYAYQTSIRPGSLKGWFAHERKIDRYHLVTGELLVFLYDDRAESPTRGLVQKVVLSEATARQVLIPAEVWHLSLNIGQTDAVLVNFPSENYDHEHPDRLYIPIDSGEIPVDVRSYFPTTSSFANRVSENFS